MYDGRSPAGQIPDVTGFRLSPKGKRIELLPVSNKAQSLSVGPREAQLLGFCLGFHFRLLSSLGPTGEPAPLRQPYKCHQ